MTIVTKFKLGITGLVLVFGFFAAASGDIEKKLTALPALILTAYMWKT